MILRQLASRFSPLPEAVRERVTTASEAELSIWAERVLFATSLDEVFAE